MNIKKKINNSVKKLLNRLPYIKTLYQQSLNCCYPNGHYYSPVFSIEDVKNREAEIWKDIDKASIQGIDLQLEEQKNLVSHFYKFYIEQPFKPEKQPSVRYHFENSYYSYTDGIILYSMIRHFKPKRIIEVGSGYSSMVMLDTNELFFENQINLTFIEPFPDRLTALMKGSDKNSITLIKSKIQQVSLSVFKKLTRGDILFIDSTHVSKTGSDVNYIFFDILPVLKSGVLIHFHDVFYPFEYPKEWVLKGINWNEGYILKAFLMYNDNFKIKYFSQFLHSFHKDVFNEMPSCFKSYGSSLWIQKQ
ncbi:MAG: class I SAM-dependent methyltransferase [Winogradskyella sp.]|uniref:class I SAM-dependent methyltransferase n=1 Tax=Winogradskyella sp. TaxID=1883156 RepID=UPI0017B49BBB|nr:class I SAM-dependent methyltransferase [Winogradskyella sp.]